MGKSGRNWARGTLVGLPDVAGQRNRVRELRFAVSTDREVAKQRGQYLNSPLTETGGASFSSPLGGVDAAVSARTTDRCSRLLGEGLSPSEVKGYAAWVREAKEREPAVQGGI